MTSFNTVWNDHCLSDNEAAVQGASMAFRRSHDYTVSYTARGGVGGVLEQLGLCEEPLHTLDQNLCPLLFGGWFPKQAQLAGKGSTVFCQDGLQREPRPSLYSPTVGKLQEGS